MVRSPTAAKIAGRTFSTRRSTASARGLAPVWPSARRMIAREGNNLSAAADQRCTASVLNMRLGNIASRCAARPDH